MRHGVGKAGMATAFTAFETSLTQGQLHEPVTMTGPANTVQHVYDGQRSAGD